MDPTFFCFKKRKSKTKQNKNYGSGISCMKTVNFKAKVIH